MKRMKIRCAVLAAVSVLAGLCAAAQSPYRFPMDVPPLLSANFAEMRTNHFHSGIDIKTGGSVGHNVYSVADGYISRISVTPGGYGRALYIAHPDGTTSVYGHLQSFMPEVEKYLTEQRYEQRKNSINLFPSPEMFPVKKGETALYDAIQSAIDELKEDGTLSQLSMDYFDTDFTQEADAADDTADSDN